MNQVFWALSELRADIPWRSLVLGVLILIIGQVFLRFFDWIVRVLVSGFKEKQSIYNFRKIVIYVYNIVLLIFFFKILKVDLKVVFGALGFMTIALAFAARTPISNLISGMFLMFERPFVVGDVIEVNEYKGEVVSLNLLSMNIRTLGNLMVRIPNEVVMGAAVRNISYFPIRRLNLDYVVSSRESLTRVEEIFKEVAFRNELALDEPEPYFSVTEFKENSVVVNFKAWSSADDFHQFEAEFPQEIHRAVKKAGMESVRQEVILHGLPPGYKVGRELT